MARPSSLPRRPSVLGPTGRETPSTTSLAASSSFAATPFLPQRVLRASLALDLLPRPTCDERRSPRGLCALGARTISNDDILSSRGLPPPSTSSPPSVGGEPHRGNSWGGRGDRPGRPEHGSGLWSTPLPRPAAGGRSPTREPAEVPVRGLQQYRLPRPWFRKKPARWWCHRFR